MNPFDKKYHQTLGTHCWYCEREYNGRNIKRTRDHIIPLSVIIYNNPKNYVGCCKQCNSLKKNLNAKEFAILLESITTKVPRNKTMINRAWKLYNKTSKLHNSDYAIKL
jgi:hypothetical protein